MCVLVCGYVPAQPVTVDVTSTVEARRELPRTYITATVTGPPILAPAACDNC